MLNEHEREDGPEEGEYHFSDEGGYESNMEEEEAKAPVVTEGSGLAAKFSSYRRFVIIGAIFAAVLLVAYLIVPPLTTSTPTDITAATTPTPAPVMTASSVAEANTAAPAAVMPQATPPASVAENSPAPAKSISNLIAAEKEKLTAEKNKAMAQMTTVAPAAPSTVTMPATQPALPPAATTVSTDGQAASSPAGAPPASSTFAAIPATAASAAAQEFIASPMGTLIGPSQTAPAPTENKAVLDRLTAIEETNTKLIGQLHFEYSQKLAAYEAQDKSLQDQVRTLNTRLASMESEMNKLVLALNKQQTVAGNDNVSNYGETSNYGGNSNNANLNPPTVAANAVPPIQSGYKPTYTVQAIIPGRAWLRSDSGETITVAEGDSLRNLGRVTKIDPYDGTIQVDTGSKVITLTYGNGDYA